MTKRTYDWSSELGLALVSDEHFADVRYVALPDAPEAAAEHQNGHFLLPILHALANARRAGGFLDAEDPAVQACKWERYARIEPIPILATTQAWS